MFMYCYISQNFQKIYFNKALDFAYFSPGRIPAVFTCNFAWIFCQPFQLKSWRVSYRVINLSGWWGPHLLWQSKPRCSWSLQKVWMQTKVWLIQQEVSTAQENTLPGNWCWQQRRRVPGYLHMVFLWGISQLTQTHQAGFKLTAQMPQPLQGQRWTESEGAVSALTQLLGWLVQLLLPWHCSYTSPGVAHRLRGGCILSWFMMPESC